MSENNKSMGQKNDQEKPDLSLIPTDALWGMAKALTYGARKYDKHNFRKGIAYSRLIAATMRHLSAFNEGENNDTESSLSHIDHAMASLAMLKFMMENQSRMDDRYIAPKNILNESTKDPEINIINDETRYLMGMKIQMRGR